MLLLLPFSLFAQVTDDFSDGDFTQNPSWSGTMDKYIINSNLQLQLNADGEGSAYLSLPFNEYETMEWQFWIREAFAPSGNNYTDVWLSADNADLSQVTQGYFLRFGEGGSSDAILVTTILESISLKHKALMIPTDVVVSSDFGQSSLRATPRSSISIMFTSARASSTMSRPFS